MTPLIATLSLLYVGLLLTAYAMFFVAARADARAEGMQRDAAE